MASHHSARPHDHARALAQRVRASREVRGWSRERLAKEAGIAVGTLARLESEGASQPGFFTVGAVAVLCFEKDESRCHRQVVLETVRKRAAVPVIPLA